MEDFLYPYNKPVVKAKYDLIIDGKIVADEIVTKNGGVGGEGMTEEERQTLVGAAQKNSDNTFSANNTFTGTLDISNAQIVTPDGWNVAELTPEAIKQVVPMDWGGECCKFGGNGASVLPAYAVGVGSNVQVDGMFSSGIGGFRTTVKGTCSIALGGNSAMTKKDCAITIGSIFEDTAGSYTCTTEGTGSITIGAGANTLNYTATDGTVAESSNAITIGCKAENKGNDSVVIGASATSRADSYSKNSGSVVIGAGAIHVGQNDVVIGKGAINHNIHSVAIGAESASNYCSVSIGYGSGKKVIGHSSVSIGAGALANYYSTTIGDSSSAISMYSIAIGKSATVNDYGATVIRSTAEDGTYTQLYFSGQNTPLALKYYPTEWEKKQDVDDQGNPKVDENGEPVMVDDKDKPTKGQAMMGYVVSKVITNEEGKQETKVLECGTNLLAALFPNHGLGDNPFQPTTTAIDGEEIMSFHPSDLDMPIEETTIEPEEYQPLPVYPIVEPTIEEIID